MNPASQDIVEAALQLTELERARVVQDLLKSLSPDAERLMDDVWVADLDRRVAAFERGDADAIPWSQVKEQG